MLRLYYFFQMALFPLLNQNLSLNIKKFTQAKFDPGTAKLSELEGEPSSSDVLIDLNIGDMVVDIKKLDKKSSFNIDSPVGTAGIRGTRVGMNIQQAPGGGFTSKVTVPQGVISFTPPPPPPSPSRSCTRPSSRTCAGFRWASCYTICIFYWYCICPPCACPCTP